MLGGLAALFADIEGESAFPSEDAKREAWFTHRDELVAAKVNAHPRRAERPAGWWLFETEAGRWPPGNEALELEALGELTDYEQRNLDRGRICGLFMRSGSPGALCGPQAGEGRGAGGLAAGVCQAAARGSGTAVRVHGFEPVPDISCGRWDVATEPFRPAR